MDFNVKLYNGDCIEVMRQLIDDGVKVDAIIADIPYGIHNNKFDTVIPFDEMWDCLTKLLVKKGNIVLFGSGLFTVDLINSNRKLYRYSMVWEKSKCGSPLTAKYMPLKKHEDVIVFGESASYYEPQMTEGKPYKRKYTPNKVNNLKYGVKGVSTNNSGTRHPSTVLRYQQKWRRQDQIHPTQKPVELMEFLVKSYCPEGGVVLDFTMGSGSTGVACTNTNRGFIGVELEENYFNIAKKRIENNVIKLKNSHEG